MNATNEPMPSAAGAIPALGKRGGRAHRFSASRNFRASSSSQAAARFLAQVAPDLRDVAAEGLADDDLGGARARQLDLDDALHLAGPVGHHQDAVGELHRLGDVVGDEQRGLLELLLDLQHLVAEQQPRLLVERGERLVHQQDLRLRGERARHRDALAHAAGQLGRIAPLEAVEPDQLDEMPRALVALAPSACRRSRAGTRRCRSRCARERSTPPGRSCRSRDAARARVSPATLTAPS